jgi:hypothetical protein
MLHGNYGLISHFLGLGKEKYAYSIYFLLTLVIVGGKPREEYVIYTLYHCFISLLNFKVFLFSKGC